MDRLARIRQAEGGQVAGHQLAGEPHGHVAEVDLRLRPRRVGLRDERLNGRLARLHCDLWFPVSDIPRSSSRRAAVSPRDARSRLPRRYGRRQRRRKGGRRNGSFLFPLSLAEIRKLMAACRAGTGHRQRTQHALRSGTPLPVGKFRGAERGTARLAALFRPPCAPLGPDRGSGSGFAGPNVSFPRHLPADFLSLFTKPSVWRFFAFAALQLSGKSYFLFGGCRGSRARN